MRIRKIFKRVGQSMTTYKYLAEVDFEIDVTKYSDKKMKDRYITDVFSLEKLETATNFKMYFDEISECDAKWWKKMINIEIKTTSRNGKYLYSFLKSKLKKVLTKMN